MSATVNENQAATLHTTAFQPVANVSPHSSNGGKKRRVIVSKKTTPSAKSATLEKAAMNSEGIDRTTNGKPQADNGNRRFEGEDEDQENHAGEEGNEMVSNFRL